LDLSTDSAAKPTAIPKPAGISTATFSKPAGMGSPVKPIGLSEPKKDSAAGSGVSWDV
jgi:hypothetical protein